MQVTALLPINLNVILIELSSPKSPVRNAGILTIKCGVPGISTTTYNKNRRFYDGIDHQAIYR